MCCGVDDFLRRKQNQKRRLAVRAPATRHAIAMPAIAPDESPEPFAADGRVGLEVEDAVLPRESAACVLVD